ncbi:hypothetical protein MP228_005495 [Amoeboaphelidium protococcarum]|nr:hypothetical protein MP228_005495 [Amoeboaphelidium protococcarum]
MTIKRLKVKSFEQRVDYKNKPYISYQIEVITETKLWVVWHRYSEFDQLARVLSIDCGPLANASLPPKSSLLSPFSGTSNRLNEKSRDQLERRRVCLDEWLQYIALDKDDPIATRWRDSERWKDFIGLNWNERYGIQQSTSSSVKRKADATGGDNYRDDMDDFADALNEIQKTLASLERQVAEKQENTQADTQGVVASSLPMSIRSYIPQLNSNQSGDLQQSSMIIKQLNDCRKNLLSIGHRLKQIDYHLQDVTYIEQQKLSDKEVIRRLDVIQNLSRQKDSLLEQVSHIKSLVSNSSRDQSAERRELLDVSSSYAPSSVRIFGKSAAEIEKMDNRDLQDHSVQVIVSQDQQLDVLLQSIRRQKHVGIAISDELDVQKAMIDDLDAGVDRTQARVSGISTQIKKLL